MSASISGIGMRILVTNEWRIVACEVSFGSIGRSGEAGVVDVEIDSVEAIISRRSWSHTVDDRRTYNTR